MADGDRRDSPRREYVQKREAEVIMKTFDELGYESRYGCSFGEYMMSYGYRYDAANRMWYREAE